MNVREGMLDWENVRSRLSSGLGDVPCLDFGNICHDSGSGHFQEREAFQGKRHGKVGRCWASPPCKPFHRPEMLFHLERMNVLKNYRKLENTNKCGVFLDFWVYALFLNLPEEGSGGPADLI